MVKTKIFDQEGRPIKEINLSPEVFGLKPKKELIHFVVTSLLAQRRRPWAHTKDRGEVRGGGRKPWRQKGTGRARHGSIRSPIWKGGGVTFGPRKERVYDKKINKKIKKQALLMSLSDKIMNNHLIILDKLSLDEIKTKRLKEIIERLGEKLKKDFKKGLLYLSFKKDENLLKSFRNIGYVQVLPIESLDIIKILKFPYLLTTYGGIKEIERKYKS